MDFESYVRGLGLDPAALTTEARAALSAAWRASLRAEEPVPVIVPAPQPAATQPAVVPAQTGGRTQAEVDLEKAVADAERENRRKADLVALCQRFMLAAPDRAKEFQEYAQLAINAGLTAKDAELEFLRRSYGNGPLTYSPAKASVDSSVIEAGLCRAIGMKRENVEKSYGEKTLSAADRHFRGGCGLQQMLVICARANGMRDAETSSFRSPVSLRRLLRAAFGDNGHEGPAAAFGPSTYDLSGILSNVMNKSIRDYFNSVESVWRTISAQRPVNDFKAVSSYALTGDLTYKLVPPGGEVHHGTLGEETYGNQAKLYALMLGIDYQHLRNDDLGAFNRVGNRLGRGGALTINQIFWPALLTSTGSFWSAGNDNYAAATSYALSALANLDNVNQAWQNRTDPDGQPMGDRARYLLTSSKWEMTARKYMRSTTITEDGGDGSSNMFAGMWEPVASTYLGNSTVDGYSVDNYFLIKDPADMPVIEVVFLDGNETPTIEMAEPDLSQLGIMTRGTHAFGVARQEHRGGFKFKQTAD